MDHSRQRSISVLIGDDDVAVRECVVDLVAAWGFQVFTASSGKSALRVLLCESVDFSILDVEMPEMTGIEVVERYLAGPWIAEPQGLPTRPGRRAMPTIFMSGNPAQEVRSAAETVGTSFLDKPFAADDMRAAVDRILAEHLT